MIKKDVEQHVRSMLTFRAVIGGNIFGAKLRH